MGLEGFVRATLTVGSRQTRQPLYFKFYRARQTTVEVIIEIQPKNEGIPLFLTPHPMSLEHLSDPDISHLSIELSKNYKLIANGKRKNVPTIVGGLYEADERVRNYCRNLLEKWMYSLEDKLEHEKDTPIILDDEIR